MKIFKHCISCVVAVAIFFSQVLGASADTLNGRFQNTGFISVMKQENGVIKTVKDIIRQFSGQSSEKGVQKVAGLIGAEVAIFGLLAYLFYFFSAPALPPHQKPGQRAFTAFARSAWALIP
ncbi:hypothetical protein [Bartonella tribocorum]|uniref:Uncharacterized protein n=1 Tax=Bartonella tribocorum (strain DSM 28219 / CCUG 45778 / CIP 105476 / IBS 506) TaxID=382640 RepID=A9IVX9_BART1|nr:hypothetical protein [Bartonella tribocorum]CAK01828.1 hypothetical protein BT_1479 [Bartonella tribocorum CIP 105476]CDO49077.1 hypothetical membrane protein [Bartonella tribocorum]